MAMKKVRAEFYLEEEEIELIKEEVKRRNKLYPDYTWTYKKLLAVFALGGLKDRIEEIKELDEDNHEN